MSQLAITQDEPKQLTPMEMVQRAFDAAIANNQGLEVIDRILAQQREMMDYNDRQDFQTALRRIQDDLKPIAKRAENKETHSKYAAAEDIDNAIDSLLSRERMSLSFEPEPHPLPEMLRIVGVLSLGAYSKRYPLDVPADGKGAKGGGVMSRTHATGSAITYGKRYLKNMIFNLRFKEKDDDGNRAAGFNSLPVEVYAPLMEAIESARTLGEITAAYLNGLKVAGKIGDRTSIDAFERAANKRKGELK